MKKIIKITSLLLLIPSTFAREDSYISGIFESLGTDVFNYIIAFLLPTFIVYFALNNAGIVKNGDNKGLAGISGTIGLITAFYVIITDFDFMSFIMGWFWIILAISLAIISWNIIKSFSGVESGSNIASGALFLSIISLSFAFIFEGMVENTSCSTGFGMNFTSNWFNFCNGALVNDALTIGSISFAVAAISFFSNIPKDSAGEGLGSRIVDGLLSRRETIPNSDKDDPSNLPPVADYEAKFLGSFFNSVPGHHNNYEDFKSSLWTNYDAVLDLTATLSGRLAIYQNDPAPVPPAPPTMPEADRANIARTLQSNINSLTRDIQNIIDTSKIALKEIKVDKSKIKKFIKRFGSNSDPGVSTDIATYRTLLSRYEKSTDFHNEMVKLLEADKKWLNQYIVKYSNLGNDTNVCNDFEKRFKRFKNITNFKPSIFKNITMAQITQRKELHTALSRMHIK